MSNLTGAVIGALIDRRDGDSGIKGALIGAGIQAAARLAVPLATTFAIGWAVKYGARRTWRAWRGRRGGAPPIAAEEVA